MRGCRTPVPGGGVFGLPAKRHGVARQRYADPARPGRQRVAAASGVQWQHGDADRESQPTRLHEVADSSEKDDLFTALKATRMFAQDEGMTYMTVRGYR